MPSTSRTGPTFIPAAEREPGLPDRPDRKVYALRVPQQQPQQFAPLGVDDRERIGQPSGRRREAGQTMVIVTHDPRVAATADRLISMRDGAFVDETMMTGGTRGNLGALAGLEG